MWDKMRAAFGRLASLYAVVVVSVVTLVLMFGPVGDAMLSAGLPEWIVAAMYLAVMIAGCVAGYMKSRKSN